MPFSCIPAPLGNGFGARKYGVWWQEVQNPFWVCVANSTFSCTMQSKSRLCQLQYFHLARYVRTLLKQARSKNKIRKALCSFNISRHCKNGMIKRHTLCRYGWWESVVSLRKFSIALLVVFLHIISTQGLQLLVRLWWPLFTAPTLMLHIQLLFWVHVVLALLSALQ